MLSLITNFIIFLHEDFIHCMINNSIFIFLSVKFIYVCGIVPAVLNRPNFNILRTKVSQDLAFILWMPGAMYETCVFLYILWVIYISFPALASALDRLGVSILWGGLSSHFPDLTITVGIFPCMYFIITDG